MTKSVTKLLGIPALVVMLAVSAGCATNKDLAEVRAIAENAQQTANEAKATADEANRRTTETDQKIDEMFRKTMEK